MITSAAKEKEKCTGCGQCCLAEKCGAAVIAFGDKDEICPALRHVDNIYRCGLVLVEQEAMTHKVLSEPIVSFALGIGVGCTNECKNGN